MKNIGGRVTSLDVAALAGVSQSAVSRAFTPGSSISPAKRELILAAARKLNYVPNSIASSLTTRRTNMVAVILGNLDNPFYVLVLKSLIEALQARGTQILTFTVPNGGSSDNALMRVLRYQVDGIILTSAQLSTRMTSMCHDRGIPVVLFNRYIPGSDASGVRCDNAGGGRLMAEALLLAGARSFAVLKGDPKGTTSQDRLQGFAERLLEEGIPRSRILELEGQSVYDGAHAATLQAFRDEKKPIPDAIFGINDTMAMGAMDALRGHMGVTIPQDVMFGGFDNIDEADRWPYRLTTISQPAREMVDETLKLLDLDNPGAEIEPGIDIKVPGKLIWRDTIPRQA
ncbi:LacI family DNA-binding transcriptional regulator [Paracoccus sp. 22332]|uniref:LacI family DNA-binding transcriptional regulator n=1 Tax=Paracoccus sp. 22332 TaxID=3453913 RepID=UPI003F84854D